VDRDLARAILNFESVLKSCKRICKSGNSVARAFSRLYALKTVHMILASIALTIKVDIDAVIARSHSRNVFDMQMSLPDDAVVHSLSPSLIDATMSSDGDGIFSALEKMGILALYAVPERQLGRLEIISSHLAGQPRLIFFVELAIFAAELGDLQRAGKYAIEARTLAPRASELHDLYSIEGLIALHEGDCARAAACLEQSIDVCFTNEYACMSCGARAPNFMLAEKLLEQGGRDSVLKFLTESEGIWATHRRGLTKLINDVRSSEIKELRAPGLLGAMGRPPVRMLDVYARACLSGEEPRTSRYVARADVVADRDKLRDEYRRTMGTAIKGKLESSKN
jgi:hypothetical protein